MLRSPVVAANTRAAVWRLGALSCAVGLAVGGMYWTASLLAAPDDPVLLRLLYRYDGDSDYLPLTFALARGEWSDFIHFEGARGPLPFPWVSQAVHAALVMVLGPWGFAWADIVVCAVLFALWLSVARRLAPVDPATQLLLASTLFLMSGPLDPEAQSALGRSLPLWSVSSAYWEFRYPRPFVTSVLTLAFVLALTRADEGSSSRRGGIAWRYVACGVLLGLLLQGDLHGAFTLGLVAAALVSYRAVQRRELRSALHSGGALALGLLPTATPFLIQASSASTELRRRWGEFPLPRLAPILYLPGGMVILILALALVLVRIGGARTARREDWGRDVSFALVSLGAGVAAVVALPLFSVLTGRQIQQYHFMLRAEEHLRLTWLLTACIGIRHVALVSGFTRTLRRVVSARLRLAAQLAAFALVWLAGGRALVRLATLAANTDTQPLVKLSPGWPPAGSYRRDLAALLRELAGGEYRSRVVLGTFDQPLSMAWASMPDRSLFVPDVFLSSAPDSVVLRRTATLAKCLGASNDWFAARLGEMYFQTRFMSLDRWQASTGYTAAPLSAYTPVQRTSISRSRRIDSWHVEVPPSEIERQLRVFASSRSCAPGRLDVVVHARVGPFAMLPGRVAGFEKRFENATFVVWTRPSLPSPPRAP